MTQTTKSQTRSYSSKNGGFDQGARPRPIFDIAAEIRSDWKKPYYGAVPYLEAMGTIDEIGEVYYEDTAKSVVLYFLANATTWKGEVARRVKKELNAMAKSVK
jgi:hypothetical protein